MALVPTAEIQRYAIDLRSLTGGRGRSPSRHDHYDVMPQHLLEALRPQTVTHEPTRPVPPVRSMPS